MLRLSGCVKGIQSTDISMGWCTIACAINRCLQSWFSFGLRRVGDQSWCVSWSVPPGACMPYRLLQPSEEYLAGCSDCPVSWYGTKHLKYINIEGHCTVQWKFGVIPRVSVFQSWVHSTTRESLQCSVCFVLGTISSTCLGVVSLLESLLMLELSFLESNCSGRKALWSSCRDRLTRTESGKMRTLNWYTAEKC